MRRKRVLWGWFDWLGWSSVGLLSVVVIVMLAANLFMLGWTVGEQQTRSQIATAALVARMDAQQATKWAEQYAQPVMRATRRAELGATASAGTATQSVAATATAQPTATRTPWPTFTLIPTNTPGGSLYRGEGVLVLEECRGLEGSVWFAAFEPQSLHAHQRLTFALPTGRYRLQIAWLDSADLNVDTEVLVVGGLQRLAFGDQCVDE